MSKILLLTSFLAFLMTVLAVNLAGPKWAVSEVKGKQ